ncbi:hypothetical protein GW17_00039965 [Ensete ventricosum]|nr:hypothetical protein GW17_00039965 [Ensete ventricosum]
MGGLWLGIPKRSLPSLFLSRKVGIGMKLIFLRVNVCFWFFTVLSGFVAGFWPFLVFADHGFTVGSCPREEGGFLTIYKSNFSPVNNRGRKKREKKRENLESDAALLLHYPRAISSPRARRRNVSPTYQSVRLSVRGLLVTGWYRQNQPSVVDFGRRRSIEGEKGKKKKKKRKRRKKKKRGRRKKYLVLYSPARCRRLRVAHETDTSLLAVEMLTCFFCVCEGPCYAIERDYYEILGIPKDASLDDIKKAFHAVGILLSLAKKYHPDANKNNPTSKRKFQEIRDAYEVRSLNMREKHMQLTYRFSLAWTFATQLGKTPYCLAAVGGRLRRNRERKKKKKKRKRRKKKEEEEAKKKRYLELSSFARRRRPRAGDDTAVLAPARCRHSWIACELSPLARFFSPCGEKRSRRHGRGHPVNAKPSRCPTCNGVGTVSFFLFPFTSTCSSCRGLGKIIKVDKDPVYLRDGADVYVDTHISFTQAMIAILGGNVEVPTLFGKTKVKIPKGVQPGQLLILRGRGANYMMKLSGLPKQIGLVDHGDQYVRFRVHFPS